MRRNSEKEMRRKITKVNKKMHGPRFSREITGVIAGTRWEKIDSCLKKSVKLKHISRGDDACYTVEYIK